MPRKIGPEGSGLERLFKALSGSAPAAPARPKKEKRLRLASDSRRGMSGRAVLAGYAAQGPMTLEELLARLAPDQRAAVLALSEARQNDLLAVYEAMDRRLEAPAGHKAAVLDKLARLTTNGRLLRDRHGQDGLLPPLAARVDGHLAGALRGRMAANLFLSQIVDLIAEPRPEPVRSGAVAERQIAALTQSLAIAWPADWVRLAVAFGFEGGWKGAPAVLKAGGSVPDTMIRASLLELARLLPDEDPPSDDRRVAQDEGLALHRLDTLARLLETDRGAEIDVEGRDPSWAIAWLQAQIAAGFPAQVGLVLDGKAATLRVRQLGPRQVITEAGVLPAATFEAALRRVILDGEFLSRVQLT